MCRPGYSVNSFPRARSFHQETQGNRRLACAWIAFQQEGVADLQAAVQNVIQSRNPGRSNIRVARNFTDQTGQAGPPPQFRQGDAESLELSARRDGACQSRLALTDGQVTSPSNKNVLPMRLVSRSRDGCMEHRIASVRRGRDDGRLPGINPAFLGVAVMRHAGRRAGPPRPGMARRLTAASSAA